MKTTKYLAGICFGALALGITPLKADTATWTGLGLDNVYTNPLNWDTFIVPNVGAGDTAIINNGAAVTYDQTTGSAPVTGDFAIGNGGTLQVTNGSWTQVNGGAWIQMGAGGAGNGHILVNGGTFNSGTAGNNPFNVSGTGNTFTITSGAANFTNKVNAVNGIAWNIAGGTTSMNGGALNIQNGGSVVVSAGTLLIGGDLVIEQGSTWTQTGGVVTLATGAELDFSSTSGASMSGGTLNVSKLLTGVNGPTGSTFNFSGGIINDGATAFAGFYGADNANHPFNFTLGSTGVLNFLNGNVTVSQVNAYLAAGGIQFNNTIDVAAFSVTQLGNTVSLSLVAVPEPSTYALLGVGLITLVALRRRVRVKA